MPTGTASPGFTPVSPRRLDDQRLVLADVEVDEQLGTQPLHRHRPALDPDLAPAAEPQVLRPHPDLGRRVARRVGPVAVQHVGRQDVHLRRADEAGDEPVGRVVVELERRAELHHPAVVQHHDPVGQRHRLDLVVRDVDHRGARARGAAWRSRCASARAAPRRGWRAARRTGRRCGSRTIARPIATRCRCPPESWLRLAVEQVRRAAGCAPRRRTRRSASALSALRELQAEGHVLETVMCG